MRASSLPVVLPVLMAGLAACTPKVEPVLVASELGPGLLSVRAPAADDVWIVGSSPEPDDGSGPALVHYDGAAYTRLDTSAWPGTELWWAHVSDSEIIAVGSDGLILQGDRDGTFTRVEGPEDSITFFGVWGANADDIWAVGGRSGDTAGPAVWRRVDGTWSAFDVSLVDGFLFKVVGADSDDVWFVGAGGVSLHWDGTELARVDTGHPTAPLLTVDLFNGVPIAVGGAGNGLILEYNGSSWDDVSPDFQPGFNGVCAGAEQAWAVGQSGARARKREGVWVTDFERDLTPLIRDSWHGCAIDPDGGAWMVGGRISSRPLKLGAIAYEGPHAPAAFDVGF